MKLLYIWVCGRTEKEFIDKLFTENPDKIKQAISSKHTNNKKKKLPFYQYYKHSEKGIFIHVRKSGYIYMQAPTQEILRNLIIRYKMKVKHTKYVYSIALNKEIDKYTTRNNILRDKNSKCKVFAKRKRMIDIDYDGKLRLQVFKKTLKISTTLENAEDEMQEFAKHFIQKYAVAKLKKGWD